MFKPISNYLPQALVVVCTALAAANWYLHPERALVWATVVVVLACMTLALVLVHRRSPRQPEAEVARPSKDMAGDSIRSGIVWAGLIVLITLSAKLASALGATGNADLAWRAVMAIVGIFLVVTGNAIPKTLTPLSAGPCDTAKVQAFHRFVGWTWVLTGLAFTITWLVLPDALAERLTFLLLPGAILITLFRYWDYGGRNRGPHDVT